MKGINLNISAITYKFYRLLVIINLNSIQSFKLISFVFVVDFLQMFSISLDPRIENSNNQLIDHYFMQILQNCNLVSLLDYLIGPYGNFKYEVFSSIFLGHLTMLMVLFLLFDKLKNFKSYKMLLVILGIYQQLFNNKNLRQ